MTRARETDAGGCRGGGEEVLVCYLAEFSDAVGYSFGSYVLVEREC
jgi:hypothetical protein